MSIIHLIVFLLQFFLFVPLFFFLFIKSPKGSKNKKVFLAVALISICYASVDAYFHRYLIASDFYYVQGDWKKSGEIAEKGFNYLEDKSELYDFAYGRFSLYRKMKRAKEKDPEQKGPAVNEAVTVEQEVVEPNEPSGNEEVTTRQEAVDQNEPTEREEVTAEQEIIEQNAPTGNEEVTAEQEAIEQEEPAGNEDATTTQAVGPLE
ncbi:MAG: hypothetical protein D3917_02285 [Candidatus Electrothrix sp. AX5]|jgi:hypothetical protein|nr:hypothetical protein [Candidatus Electrothrix sp. AX5]